MSDKILEYHNEVLEKIGVPEWALINCPLCGVKLERNCIRNIGVCLNTRNLGDLSVEYHCKVCTVMDTVYFRKAVKDGIEEFAQFIEGVESPEAQPVVEARMYQQKYNNLVERLIGDKNNVDD